MTTWVISSPALLTLEQVLELDAWSSYPTFQAVRTSKSFVPNLNFRLVEPPVSTLHLLEVPGMSPTLIASVSVRPL
jgi:hypothetical protein